MSRKKVMEWAPKLRTHQLKTEKQTDTATLKLLGDFLQLCEKPAVKVTKSILKRKQFRGIERLILPGMRNANHPHG